MSLPHNDYLALFAHFYMFPRFLLPWGHTWIGSQGDLFHRYTFLVQVHLTGWYRNLQWFTVDFGGGGGRGHT